MTRCVLCEVFLHFPALKVLRSTNGGPSTSTQHCMAVTACHSYDLLAAPHQERNLSWRFFVLLQWLKSWNWNIFLERTQPFKPAHASVSSTSFEPRAFDELRSLQSWGHEPWMYVWIAPVCMYNDVYLLDVNITKNCMSAQCIWTWQDRGVPVPGFGVFQFYLSTRTSSNSKKPWGGEFLFMAHSWFVFA